MLASVIFFNFRSRNLKIGNLVCVITPPPLPFSLVVLEQGSVLASHFRLILTIKTFSTDSKANYNKLETQNGGGGGGVGLLVKAF